jgi:predicted porin
MKLKYLLLMCLVVGCVTSAESQVFIGGRFGGRFGGGARYGYGSPRPRPNSPKKNQPKFKPVVIVSIGYGFPNLDKLQLPDYFNYYKGTASQSGPFTGAIDYQFNPTTSIGLLVTHGTVNMPYYSYNNPTSPSLNGALDNWSYMINFLRYIPASKAVTPYIRTAIGINSWSQNFTDGSGNNVYPPVALPDLAYQIGIGAKFNVSKNTGFFVEGGYGKYILHGGLSFKF